MGATKRSSWNKNSAVRGKCKTEEAPELEKTWQKKKTTAGMTYHALRSQVSAIQTDPCSKRIKFWRGSCRRSGCYRRKSALRCNAKKNKRKSQLSSVITYSWPVLWPKDALESGRRESGEVNWRVRPRESRERRGTDGEAKPRASLCSLWESLAIRACELCESPLKETVWRQRRRADRLYGRDRPDRDLGL